MRRTYDTQGHGHTLRSCDLPASYFLNPLTERFSLNFTLKMFLLVRRCGVQNTLPSYIDSMSQVKVMGYTPTFRVCSISTEPFERFSLLFSQMLFTVSWCVEAMTQLCKVKVTLQGHGILWRGGGGVAVFQTAVLYICVNKLFEFRSGTKTAEISIFYQLSKGTQL